MKKLQEYVDAAAERLKKSKNGSTQAMTVKSKSQKKAEDAAKKENSKSPKKK